MPDAQVALHRLSALIEGVWLSPQMERELQAIGIDPEQFQQACRERIAARYLQARDNVV